MFIKMLRQEQMDWIGGIKLVLLIIEQLKKFGKTQRGWLGVRIQEITPDIAKSLGLKNEEGVLISMVNPGEPAEKED